MVLKTSTLTEFKSRRELWRECLCGNDSNSIASQLTRMMFKSAVWRFINECRKIAPRDSNDRIRLNGMISNFVDECFAENQLMHIRRLADQSPIDGDLRREVYSLVSLLNDLIDNFHLITRENVFLSEDREYDVEKAKEEFFKKTDKGDSFEAHILQPGENYMASEKRHEEFDFLSGVNPRNRTPGDLIRKSLLENLRDRIIDASQKIKIFSDKNLAHPATPGSRQIGRVDELVWSDLLNAQKLITQTVCFLNHYLFKNFVISFIPGTPSNKFEFLECPLLLEKDLEKAEEMWDEFEKEAKDWKKWDTSEFLKNL